MTKGSITFKRGRSAAAAGFSRILVVGVCALLATLTSSCTPEMQDVRDVHHVRKQPKVDIAESMQVSTTSGAKPRSVHDKAGATEPRESDVTRNFSRLRADGAKIVDESGEQVILKGCNLGNWFLLEMWMLDMPQIRDQHHFEKILAERASISEKNRLLELYRANWIQERDFEIIKTFGFNCVRIPFHHLLLEKELTPGELKKDAFKWLDKAVNMAAEAGLYVILDMHGLPGGQSTDHTTGFEGQNYLYENGDFQKRTIALWRKIAEHYKDSNVIAAYDLINEPFGNTQDDSHHGPLIEIYDRIYKNIRDVGDEHLIFVAGTRDGIEFLGHPEKDHGWKNVGLTEHYYPGLFGEPETLESHAKFLARKIPWLEKYIEELQVPFLVGEFNAVHTDLGGPDLMRMYYDLFAMNGWAATMWTYKLVQRDGGLPPGRWFMVKNRDPYGPPNIKRAPREQVIEYFRWLGSMDYVVNEQLRQALTADMPNPLEMPPVPVLPMEPPASDELVGWKLRDINGALAGGQKALAEDAFELYGGGSDIWGRSDQFRFAYKLMEGDFVMTAILTNVVDSHKFAKGGLMVRKYLDPDAPHLFIHAFPDGTVSMSWRTKEGHETEEERFEVGGFPVHMMIKRSDHVLSISYSVDGKRWWPLQDRILYRLPAVSYVGTAVTSHDNRYLTTASFRNLRVKGKEIE